MRLCQRMYGRGDEVRWQRGSGRRATSAIWQLQLFLNDDGQRRCAVFPMLAWTDTFVSPCLPHSLLASGTVEDVVFRSVLLLSCSR